MRTEPPRTATLAVSIWTALTLFAALLWSRRLSGDFPGPMPVGWVIAWTALVGSVSALAWSRFPSKQHRPWPTVIAVLVALITSLGGAPGLTPTSLGVLLGMWCLTGIVVVAWRTDSFVEWAVPTTINTTNDAMVSTAHPTKEKPALYVEESATNDETLQQTMSRRLLDEGEVVEGVCRLALAAGQRETTVHVSFCPPLTAAPQVELEDVDGHGWELKVAAAYPFGLRVVVRRGRDCGEAVSGRIAYWAIGAAPATAA